jgi:hypothetical protein
MADFGYGHLTPYRATSEFNVIDFMIAQKLATRLNTTKLVQVVAVHGGGVDVAGTVDVFPLVSPVDGNANATPHGVVYGLPWSRVQGGANAIICDPAVNDVGYVVFSDRDISAVKNGPPNGSASTGYTPGSFRKFDIADGIYAGGCLNVAPTQYLIFTATGVRLVDANGNSITTGINGMTLADLNGNQIEMRVGFVNIVTPVLQVNGVPVVVP